MTDKSTKQILIDAKALIADVNNWNRGSLKRTSFDGLPCYCVIGAIGKVTIDDFDARVDADAYTGTNTSQVIYDAMETLPPAMLLASVVDHGNPKIASALIVFNDVTSGAESYNRFDPAFIDAHATVMQAFDNAIALA